MMNKKLYYEHTALVPPPPTKFTQKEWYLNNRLKDRCCLDQQQLADKILAECQRGKTEINEVTLANKREVDHKLDEKIQEVEFVKREMVQMRKVLFTEVDNITTYSERIMDALNSLRSQALIICKKCLMFREGRKGIDLVSDDVERELLKESDVIGGAEILLVRTLEQSNEQIRRLKATTYVIDRDLMDKTHALETDNNNLGLNEHSLNLSMYHGFTPLDCASTSAEDWLAYTMKSISSMSKEINCARNFRAYVDVILRQVVSDLWDQYHAVNEAFRRRIEETKEAKTKFEVQHSEITRQANEMTITITDLQKCLAEKEGFMALAHTRLGNRAQRKGMELCRDLVETNLANEVLEMRANCAKLQQLLAEAKASLRYLLKTQIQLEEDLNIKCNTLQIDEVNCMTLRQSMDYHAY